MESSILKRSKRHLNVLIVTSQVHPFHFFFCLFVCQRVQVRLDDEPSLKTKLSLYCL